MWRIIEGAASFFGAGDKEPDAASAAREVARGAAGEEWGGVKD